MSRIKGTKGSVYKAEMYWLLSVWTLSLLERALKVFSWPSSVFEHNNQNHLEENVCISLQTSPLLHNNQINHDLAGLKVFPRPRGFLIFNITTEAILKKTFA